MKQGITVCGNIFVDHIKQVDCYPKVSMLANIRAESRCVGGCVSNTGLALSRLDPGVPVRAAGAVGADADGTFILDYYRQGGLDPAGIRVDPRAPTGYTDVISASDDHSRTFFNCRGVNALFGPEDIAPEALDCAIFHMGYALLLDRFDAEDPAYGTVMARTLHEVQQRGIRTSIDVVSEDGDRFQRIVTASLPYCNYLIINEVEGGRITGISPAGADGSNDPAQIRSICARLLDLGVAEHVVIHCREGGYLMNAAREFYVVPSLVLPDGYIKGSVGAGDAFCAGVLCGLARGYAPTELLQLGAGTAAACLAGEDSVSGIRGLGQVQELVRLYSAQ